MNPRTVQLPKISPYLDETFVHVWGRTLIDTGHPTHREVLLDAIDPDRIDTVLLTSRDVHCVGNLDAFPNASVYALGHDDSIHVQHSDQPGMRELTELLFPNLTTDRVTTIAEGDAIDLGHAVVDVISAPVPDRSGAMFHEPDKAITFVGAIPAGRLPMWCADAEDFAIAVQRLDAIPLGGVFSRVDPPNDNGSWFKKRAQRFVEHFGSTLGEKRSSPDLIAFLENDFGGIPEEDGEWAASILRYQAFF